MLEALKGYKTVIFNVLMALATITSLLSGTSVEGEVMQLSKGFDLLLEALIIIWSAGNIWLRAITDSPIFKKKK
jgi:hypothetical protein